jgi:hypothetical protein
MDLEVEAVLPRDAVTLADLGHLGRERCDLREPSRSRPDAHDGGQLVAERARVDLGALARDHLLALEALHASSDRGRREAHATIELGDRESAVGRELADDLTVDLVKCRKIPVLDA